MEPAVYDIRDRSCTDEIARRLATGEPAAFYMGMFTIMQAVGPPNRQAATGELFWQVKRERPIWSKLPVFLRPRDALRLIDFGAVHPEFRHRLRTREAFTRLWSHGAPMHVVAPLRDGLRTVNSVLVATPDEAAAASADRRTEQRTAAMFWMQDAAWAALADALARRCPPRRFLVGSSFNDHGEHPPYTLAELFAATAKRSDLAYGFVIHDPLLESCAGHSSHSLVRLPQIADEPVLHMLRQGSVSPSWLHETTGFAVEKLASATMAVRRTGISDGDLRSAFEQLAAARGPMSGQMSG
jgi:hypothetical protein